MKIKKSFFDIVFFNKNAQAYIEKNKQETKLSVSLRSVLKQTINLEIEYQEKLEDLRCDHCAVDSSGVISKDARGGYQYTPEKMKAFNIAAKTLRNIEVEVHTRIRPENDELIKDLSFDEIDAFKDIVITKPKEE